MGSGASLWEMCSVVWSQGPLPNSTRRWGEVATHPFQYALSTRDGTECVTHIVQALTSEKPESTIDGVGACDSICRNAMFRGVADMCDGDKLIPFVRLFYGSPSTYLWEDDTGKVHHVQQGEEGEQGDPLKPLLFSLGKHRALVTVKSKLKEGEKLFAFLDDVYVICTPKRVLDVFRLLETELHNRVSISIHQGKTQIWNRGVHEPVGAAILTAAARREKPEAVVWRANPFLPPFEQGLMVLGAPVGQLEYVLARLSEKGVEHDRLLEKILQVQDVQASWLLLLFCAGARANFLMRTVEPELTQKFASHHDEQLVQCLRRVLQLESLPANVKITASMLLTLGRLGIGSALRTRGAAHWGSWADCLEMIQN